MSTEWIYRHHLIVAAGEREAANLLAAAIDPDAGGGVTFGVPLSASGEAPATHYGCSSAATEAMRAEMGQALAAGSLSTLLYWRCDAATGVLQDSNASPQRVGQVCTWADALSDAGLAVVPPAGGGL